MEYDNIKEGHFLERPNRFIAYVDIERRKRKGPCEKHREMPRASDRKCTGVSG